MRAAARRAAAAARRLLDRRVGDLQGEAARAAGTLASFLVFADIATNVVMVVLFVLGALPAGLFVFGLVLNVLYLVGLLALRRGAQLEVAIGFLGIALVAVVTMTFLVGWREGYHLYLLTITQVVYIVFTEQQRRWRMVFVVAGAVAFVACQLLAPSRGPLIADPDADHAVLFTMNAVIIGIILFFLAAVAHRRTSLAQDRAAQQAARAEYLANTDPLTGLANRRPIAARLEELSSRADRAYAVAVADLDHFKALNDEHGHLCGDRVLAALGARLRTHLRATDALGRWGGEEFMFVLEHTTAVEAHAMMDRMRRLVGDRALPCADHSHRVTLSVGVADNADGARASRVVKRADEALYAAKVAGRDRVTTWGGASEPDHASSLRGGE